MAFHNRNVSMYTGTNKIMAERLLLTEALEKGIKIDLAK